MICSIHYTIIKNSKTIAMTTQFHVNPVLQTIAAVSRSWKHEQLGPKLPVEPEEANLAFVIGAYSRTYRSSIELHAEQPHVRSEHGLILHTAQSTNRTLDATVLHEPLGDALDVVLRQTEQRYGRVRRTSSPFRSSTRMQRRALAPNLWLNRGSDFVRRSYAQPGRSPGG